jgi:restriction endonuclease S subunit
LDGLLQLAGGGTFPNLSRNDIGGFKIPYSDRVEKIASILSAYDDLIENNLKRIKLLEELEAQIYLTQESEIFQESHFDFIKNQISLLEKCKLEILLLKYPMVKSIILVDQF